MAIVEKLTPWRKKFFESIGIYSDEDIPNSFFDEIVPFTEVFSEAEKFCLDDYDIAFCMTDLFQIKNLVGTNHDKYAGKTWLEAFLELARGEETLELYFKNPSYYEQLKEKENVDIGLAQKDGKYYLLGSAGGGNNRMIIMKLKYLALSSKQDCDLEKIDKELSFCANIRTAPREDVSENIFDLMFPNGGYSSSGYQVINRTVQLDNPRYDIVTDSYFNPEIVASNLSEEDLNLFNNKKQVEIKKQNK